MKKRQLILLGNTGVGKSTIFHSFKKNKFTPIYDSTLGVDSFELLLNDNKELIIYDTAGQEKYFKLSDNYLKNSDIAIIIYNPSTETKNEEIKYWLDQIADNALNCYFILFICNDKRNCKPNKNEEIKEISNVINEILPYPNSYSIKFLSYKFSMNELKDILVSIENTENAIISQGSSFIIKSNVNLQDSNSQDDNNYKDNKINRKDIIIEEDNDIENSLINNNVNIKIDNKYHHSKSGNLRYTNEDNPQMKSKINKNNIISNEDIVNHIPKNESSSEKQVPQFEKKLYDIENESFRQQEDNNSTDDNFCQNCCNFF